METGCPFCVEIANHDAYRRDWNPNWPHPDRILFEAPGVIIVPGHGPQVYPYALVIPTVHRPSFMSLNAEERAPLFAALDFLAGLSVYGKYLCVFEHGGGSGNSCQCVDHCHLHVISIARGLQSAFLQSEMRERSKSIELDDAKHRQAPESYLFIGMHGRGYRTLVGEFVTPAARERQYFRRLLAETMGLDWFDWRTGANQAFMEQLYHFRQSST
jgi:diadenosine tetraphosphate (Ap4A) HIT family hydrolase